MQSATRRSQQETQSANRPGILRNLTLPNLLRCAAGLAQEPVRLVNLGHAFGGLTALQAAAPCDAVGMVKPRQLAVGDLDLLARARCGEPQDAAGGFDPQRLVASWPEFSLAIARMRRRFFFPRCAETFGACVKVGIFARGEDGNAGIAEEIGKRGFTILAAPPLHEILGRGRNAYRPAFDEKVGIRLEVFAQRLLDLVDKGGATPWIRPLRLPRFDCRGLRRPRFYPRRAFQASPPLQGIHRQGDGFCLGEETNL
jgi:hypothetical protein